MHSPIKPIRAAALAIGAFVLLSQVACAESAASVASAAACGFTRNLELGDEGADVQCLQKFLNSTGYTVAATGVGSPGRETTQLGALTEKAIAKWQAANPDRVMQQLSEHDLIPEAWGGDTMFNMVSAVTGDGVDELLESLLLVSEVEPDRQAGLE